MVLIEGIADQIEIQHGWLTFPNYRKPIKEDGTSLWPERWPLSALAARKQSMGPIAWAQEMENNPIPEDNSYFTLAKFEDCYRADLEFVWQYEGTNPTFIGVDSQISLKTGADYGCLFVIEFNPDNETRKILWIERGRWGFKIANLIDEFDRRYRPSKVKVENNAAQDFIIQHMKNEDSLVPVEGFTTGDNKPDIYIGIPYLAATVDAEKWLIPRGGIKEKEMTDQWVKEALEYGQGHSGDVLMASWFANDGARELSRLGLTNIVSVENATGGERDFKTNFQGVGDTPSSFSGPAISTRIQELNHRRGFMTPTPRNRPEWRPQRGATRSFRG